MRTQLSVRLAQLRATFATFTAGQKLVTLIGTGALLMAAVITFQWASTPAYAPLYTGMSTADSAAVVEELNSTGVPYQIEAGGGTLLVPADQVDETRLAMAAKGLPETSGESGYSLLDDQTLATSRFQEQTSYKRAMEGELANTIESLEGVDTAVVHLVMPERTVFAESQDPATASVLLDLGAAGNFSDDQAAAVVHLVASAVEGLDPDQVTISDQEGRLLSGKGAASSTMGTGSQTEKFEASMSSRIQTMLDEVLGAGNATVSVTADLDFDKSTTTSTDYSRDRDTPAVSSAREEETYEGQPTPGVGGVVGVDGQMEVDAAGGTGNYSKTSVVEDQALDVTTEVRESAPGRVRSLHAAVVVDSAAGSVDPAAIEELVRAGLGLDDERGDTVAVSALPFDRSAEDEAAKELATAAKADSREELVSMIREAALVLLVLIMALAAWWQGRRRNARRSDATNLIIEQLRNDAVATPQPTGAAAIPSTSVLALEESDEAVALMSDLRGLIENQPDDVASLLRGWLVDQ